MKFTFTREVELSDEEVRLLKLLRINNFLWNYATEEFDLKTFDSIVRKGLAHEDSDGRVSISRDGLEIIKGTI